MFQDIWINKFRYVTEKCHLSVNILTNKQSGNIYSYYYNLALLDGFPVFVHSLGWRGLNTVYLTFLQYISCLIDENYCLILMSFLFLPMLFIWVGLYIFHVIIKVCDNVRINLPLFSTVVPSSICMFLSCRPFVVITTLSTGLVGVEVKNIISFSIAFD